MFATTAEQAIKFVGSSGRATFAMELMSSRRLRKNSVLG